MQMGDSASDTIRMENEAGHYKVSSEEMHKIKQSLEFVEGRLNDLWAGRTRLDPILTHISTVNATVSNLEFIPEVSYVTLLYYIKDQHRLITSKQYT
jgi:hypothetical protein